ncbi:MULTISPECIES: winged helix-turn-helix domain-containing protein [unclassified Streptomyces]|uniref:winged helix-turn-helix domain-containing protein n=1 Tax=unclassified Streptomyces TaxID=2593676 RepID=UPI001F1D60C2|nr:MULTISPECIES: winged helix-turn-helix domain-containing protein [unclassified Streptomyces]
MPFPRRRCHRCCGEHASRRRCRLSHPVGPGPESARAFHVSYSVSGATRLMHRFGFSPQAPAPPSTMSRLSPRGKTRPGPR